MTKKDILFLLVPSALFAAMAGLLLFYATAFFPDRNHEQRTQKRVDELVRKVQSGELGPKPDKLVEMLSRSWRREDGLQEDLTKFHAQISRYAGCGILLGIVAQMYAIFRVKAGLRKPHV
jgi:hypothetical protein